MQISDNSKVLLLVLKRVVSLLQLLQSYNVLQKDMEIEPQLVVHFKVEAVTLITKNFLMHSQCCHSIKQLDTLLPHSVTEVPLPVHNHRDFDIPRCLVCNRNMVVIEVPHQVQWYSLTFLMASYHTTPNHSYHLIASGYGHLAHSHRDTDIPRGMVCNSKGSLPK